MNRYKLLKGDCLIRMKEIEDHSIDMIMTDPPYGTTACAWDSVIHLGAMWHQLKRVIKPNGAICITGTEPFSSFLRISNIEMYRYDWIWVKRPTLFQHAKNRPMPGSENISIFSINGWGHKSQMGINRLNYYPIEIITSKIAIKNIGHQPQYTKARPNQVGKIYKPQTGFPSTVLYCKKDRKTTHPTQKPVKLMEYLIKIYTNKNELVLDFTMGSGTTGVACMNLDRKFIGIELDKDKDNNSLGYFKIAKRRIKAAKLKRNACADFYII